MGGAPRPDGARAAHRGVRRSRPGPRERTPLTGAREPAAGAADRLLGCPELTGHGPCHHPVGRPHVRRPTRDLGRPARPRPTLTPRNLTGGTTMSITRANGRDAYPD